MISFCGIGKHGRLGNQMFQFAAALGVAKRIGVEAAFPRENLIPTAPKEIFQLPRCFKINTNLLKNRREIKVDSVFKEKFLHFDPNVFDVSPNTELIGFFQSEKYFDHAVNDIRENFIFDERTHRLASDFLARANRKTVAVHVRRGDFVNNTAHGDLTRYYPQALLHFDQKEFLFVIISDDIRWCRRHFNDGRAYIFSAAKNPYIDLCIMSLCNHNIIANSSYSWWGAWLNPRPNKIVIAPKAWFGPRLSHCDPKDIYCTDWIVI